MRTPHLVLCLLIFFGTSFHVFSQTTAKSKSKVPAIVAKTDSDTKKDAAFAFKLEQYSKALGLYLSLQKGDSTNVDYNYRVAVCYLNLNMDKRKAIPFLELASKQKNAPEEILWTLAKTYHASDMFEEALEKFEAYKAKFPGGKGLPKEDLIELNRSIEMCKNGKELKLKPVDVSFENLGKLINSPYPDYNPFISADESMLVFSTRRPTSGTADELGVFSSDIFYSVMKENKWTKAKSIGPAINTSQDDEVLFLSADGKKMLLYKNETETGIGDIYSTTLKGKTWSKPAALNTAVNTEDPETGATISSDGKTLIFATSHIFKEKGMGGSDLYKSNLLPDGNWSTPVNLGSSINTPYDEDAPFLHADGKTLYYSSKGLNSMGGFDIFKTVWDSALQTWTVPENIGYPINNAEDNLYFSLSVQGKFAYVSSVLPGGLGDLDIYKINFVEIQRNSYLTIIRGVISVSDSIDLSDAKVTYLSKSDPDNFGQYKPNPTSGKFVVSSKPGKYILMVDVPGCVPYKEDLDIPEIKQPEYIEKKIILIKKGVSKSE